MSAPLGSARQTKCRPSLLLQQIATRTVKILMMMRIQKRCRFDLRCGNQEGWSLLWCPCALRSPKMTLRTPEINFRSQMFNPKHAALHSKTSVLLHTVLPAAPDSLPFIFHLKALQHTPNNTLRGLSAAKYDLCDHLFGRRFVVYHSGLSRCSNPLSTRLLWKSRFGNEDVALCEVVRTLIGRRGASHHSKAHFSLFCAY